MSATGMWQINATALTVLIILNMALSQTPEAQWIAVGIVALLLAMYFCFRQGLGAGHAACGVSVTVEAARKAGDQVYAQLDRKYLSRAWSAHEGFRGVLFSALIPYCTGSAYIALTLLRQRLPSLEMPVVIARVAAWVMAVPYWPLIMHWHEDFVALTPAIGIMLLLSPFVLPACTFAGYLQGPRLWAQTEVAMKEGRRRAKAKARVGKKLAPRQQKPEI